MQQMSQSRSISRLFSVREPVRIDLAYHGARFIIGEFAIATLLSFALAAGELALYLFSDHEPLQLLGGIFFLSCMLNSLTFLLIAINTVRRHHGASRSDYRHWQILLYTIFVVILLLAPLVFPLLAIVQGTERRAEADFVAQGSTPRR
jgi:Ca2+/Na+ antiporter